MYYNKIVKKGNCWNVPNDFAFYYYSCSTFMYKAVECSNARHDCALYKGVNRPLFHEQWVNGSRASNRENLYIQKMEKSPPLFSIFEKKKVLRSSSFFFACSTNYHLLSPSAFTGKCNGTQKKNGPNGPVNFQTISYIVLRIYSNTVVQYVISWK